MTSPTTPVRAVLVTLVLLGLVVGFAVVGLQTYQAMREAQSFPEQFALAPPDVVQLCRERAGTALGEIRRWGPGRSGQDPELPQWTYLNEVWTAARPGRTRRMTCVVDVGGSMPRLVHMNLQ